MSDNLYRYTVGGYEWSEDVVFRSENPLSQEEWEAMCIAAEKQAADEYRRDDLPRMIASYRRRIASAPEDFADSKYGVTPADMIQHLQEELARAERHGGSYSEIRDRVYTLLIERGMVRVTFAAEFGRNEYGHPDLNGEES